MNLIKEVFLYQLTENPAQNFYIHQFNAKHFIVLIKDLFAVHSYICMWGSGELVITPLCLLYLNSALLYLVY